MVPGGRVVLLANYLIRQEIAVTGSLAYIETDFIGAVDLLARGVVQPNADWLEERPLSDGPGYRQQFVPLGTRQVLLPVMDTSRAIYFGATSARHMAKM